MKLPRYTILTGPRLACQILAADLSQTDAELMQVSLQTPVEAALCATFFENDPSLYIHSLLPLPTFINGTGPQADAGTFLDKYTDFLRQQYGSEVLAKLTIRALEENADYFERFAILDAEPHEILALADHFGRNHCLVIHINSPRPDISASIYSLGYENLDDNATTAERMNQLTAILEKRK